METVVFIVICLVILALVMPLQEKHDIKTAQDFYSPVPKDKYGRALCKCGASNFKTAFNSFITICKACGSRYQLPHKIQETQDRKDRLAEYENELRRLADERDVRLRSLFAEGADDRRKTKKEARKISKEYANKMQKLAEEHLRDIQA